MRLRWLAAAALLIANLIVAVAVLRHQWGYYQLLLIYFCEAIIIAIFNVGKIFVVFLVGTPFGKRIDAGGVFTRLVSVTVLIVVFGAKFVVFAFGLGLLVTMVPAFLAGSEAGAGEHVWTALQSVGPGLSTAIKALFLSHGISFLVNFLLRGEYKKAKILLLLFWPYARMSLTALVLALGLLLAKFIPWLRGSVAFVVAILAVKLAADLVSHLIEHNRVFGATTSKNGEIRN